MTAVRHCLVCLQLFVLVSSVTSFIRTISSGLNLKHHSTFYMTFDNNEWQFHVAPMQCYTNAPLRTLFQTLSNDAILWTEMEKTADLLQESLEKRFDSPGHKDIVLQLGGNDASQVKECLQRLEREGYTFDEVNLNCGCPSIETGGAATYGASLMKEPDLTRELLEAIVSSVQDYCKVSLKCRTAVMESRDELATSNSNEEEDYAKLHHYVQLAYDAGIDHLVIHARPAVLAGLNPTKNRQVPPLNYQLVERIADDFSGLRVTLNGGIQSVDGLGKCLLQDSAIASHMAGRWMLRRPLDLAQVDCRFLTCHATDKRLSACMDEYGGYIESMMRSRNKAVPLSELCLPLYLVSEQLREDYEIACDESGDDGSTDDGTAAQTFFVQEGEFDNLYDSIKDSVAMIAHAGNGGSKHKALPDCTNFKKLSASFTRLVGKKVFSKWKRNRSEV